MTTALRNHGWQKREGPFRVLEAIRRTVVYGEYGAADGQLSSPYDVAYSPDGSLLAVADAGNSRIQMFGIDDGVLTHLSSYGSAGTSEGQFELLQSLAFSPDGTRLVVSDAYTRFQIFGVSGAALTFQTQYDEPGIGDGQFTTCMSAAFSPDGTRIVTADSNNSNIQVFGVDGNNVTFQVRYGSRGAGPGYFNSTYCATFSPDGSQIIVVDTAPTAVPIQIVNIAGNIITRWREYGSYGAHYGGFINPNTVAVTPDGLWIGVADSGANRVQVLDISDAANGNIVPVMSYNGAPVPPVSFETVNSVAFSPDGAHMAICDSDNNRIIIV